MATILIVDDSALVRKILVRMLEKGGHQVVEAGDGKEALQHFKTQKIDFIITDINMPEMDGLSLAAAIRESNAGIPIIALTTEAPADNVDMQAWGEDTGISDWLIKPPTADHLLKVVGKYLSV